MVGYDVHNFTLPLTLPLKVDELSSCGCDSRVDNLNQELSD